MSLFTAFNNSAYAIYEALRGPVTSYCRLETADDESTLVADNGALISVIKLEGSLVRISPQDYDNIINNMTLKTQAMLDVSGHTIQVIFEYDPLATKRIVSENFSPSMITAKELKLDLGEILKDWEKAVARYCSGERCWVVLWTDSSVLSDLDRKRAIKETAANLAKEPFAPDCQR
ncbi:MAG: hypothetical protein ACRCTY_02140, partial [Candidatus Adiutrix sp.]